MDIKYRVYDEENQYHGTFSKLEDARIHAQDVADDTRKDVFIDKIMTEQVDCVIPD